MNNRRIRFHIAAMRKNSDAEYRKASYLLANINKFVVWFGLNEILSHNLGNLVYLFV